MPLRLGLGFCPGFAFGALGGAALLGRGLRLMPARASAGGVSGGFRAASSLAA